MTHGAGRPVRNPAILATFSVRQETPISGEPLMLMVKSSEHRLDHDGVVMSMVCEALPAIWRRSLSRPLAVGGQGIRSDDSQVCEIHLRHRLGQTGLCTKAVDLICQEKDLFVLLAKAFSQGDQFAFL